MPPNNVAQIGGELGRLKGQFCGQDGTKNGLSHYIPGPVLQKFWKSHSVAAVLGHYGISQSPAIVTESFLRAFSLLVYINRVNFLDDLVEPNLRDTAFPLEDYPPSWSDTPVYRGLFDEIAESQWIFFPVIFDQHKLYNQVLGPRHILPIRSTGLIKQGDIVQVHKIEVSSPYTDSGQAQTQPVPTMLGRQPVLCQITRVLKTYNEHGKSQYERERKTFNNLQSRRCDHIVGYYGSYRQRRHDGTLTYNLILEYVEGGNLEGFYRTMNPPQCLPDTAKVWRGFSGVLEGFHHLNHSVHDLDTQTIHQDIKPDNLLVAIESAFQAYDIRLIIADFGYSHTKVVRTPQDQWGVDSHGGQTYGAPECSHHAPYTRAGRNHITPKADIWSVGCVMSEAAVWMKFGQPGRDDYRQRRMAETSKLREFNQAGHCECFHDGAQVLRAVRDTHDFIRAIDTVDTVTLQVLDMIEESMLVAQKDRQDAQTLREQLIKILQTAGHLDEQEKISAVELSEKQLETSIPCRIHDDTQQRSSAQRPHSERRPPPFPVPPTLVRDNQWTGTNSGPMLSQPENSNSLTTNGARLSGSGVPTRSFSVASHSKHHSTPPRLESWQLPQPSPTLTFDEAKEWYENAKKPGSGVDPRVEAVILRLKNNVQGRDHIFFIDNSITMGDHFRQVKDSFKILAYLAKQFDPDGVELYFSSQASKKHHGDTTKLLGKLGEQQWDQMSFEDRIGTFIDMVIIPRLKSLRQRLGFSKPRPLTIFVMTDGRWGVGREGAAGVEGPIKRLIDEILKRKLSRTQVALQFLRFGDDEDGKRYLAYLDRYGTPFKCDCVDTKSIDGNIFDMFIGSINAEIDGVGEEEPAEMSPPVPAPTSPPQRLNNRPAPFWNPPYGAI